MIVDFDGLRDLCGLWLWMGWTLSGFSHTSSLPWSTPWWQVWLVCICAHKFCVQKATEQAPLFEKTQVLWYLWCNAAHVPSLHHCKCYILCHWGTVTTLGSGTGTDETSSKQNLALCWEREWSWLRVGYKLKAIICNPEHPPYRT